MEALTSARLRLRPLDATDVDAFVAYRRDPEVARRQSWDVDYDVAQARALVRDQPISGLPGPGDWLQLAIRPLEGGPLLGDVAVHTLADQPDTYEVGVTLVPAHQHRGHAHEALTRLLQWLFDDHGAHRVVASSDARNTAVHSLLKQVGMRHEAHRVEADWFKGEWTSLDEFAVLAGEFAREA